jgi:hypothetical protein
MAKGHREPIERKGVDFTTAIYLFGTPLAAIIAAVMIVRANRREAQADKK